MRIVQPMSDELRSDFVKRTNSVIAGTVRTYPTT